MILPLSIPEPSRCSLRERTQTLAALSLVCRDWRMWAQSRMYDHLRLGKKQLTALDRELIKTERELRPLATVTGPLATKARSANTLQLAGWIDEYGPGLKTSLRAFSNADEVYLENTKGAASLGAVAVLPNLRHLHLARVYNYVIPASGFPRLERLSLAFGLTKGINWSLLAPRNLPSVNTLTLEPLDWAFAQDARFLSAFASIAPQLDALALAGSDQGEVDFSRLLAKATKLKHLYIHTTTPRLLEALVSAGEPELDTLRIASGAATPEQVAALLVIPVVESEQANVSIPRVSESLAKLRRLTLPISSYNGWDLETAEAQVAVRQITALCAARGIELEFVKKGTAALEDWQPERLVTEDSP